MLVCSHPTSIEKKQDALANDRTFRRRSSACVCAGLVTTGIVLGMIGGIFVLTATVATTALSHRDQQEQTRLAQKMDDARDIRQALARPLPRPAPLLAMSAHVVRGPGPSVEKAKLRSNSSVKNWAPARAAFAHLESESRDTPLTAFQELDRHAIR